MASAVLRDVTNLKIARLAKQQSRYEEEKALLINRAKRQHDSLPILSEGLKKLGLDGKETDASLRNINLFLEQSKHDASIPQSLLQRCEDELKSSLDAKSRRYSFATLFANLATEWADNPKDANVLLQLNKSAEPSSPTSDSSDGFEQIGREEMHKQRQEWESFVFHEPEMDVAAINQYLSDLFVETTKVKRGGKTPLEHLRKGMKSFGVDDHDRPALMQCSEGNITSCIEAILRADLFTGSKRDVLINLKDARPAILKEIADIVNLETASLQHWEWQTTPISAHLRRQLNGKYRVYMDLEIHQAILIHWVGAQFAVHLKKSFVNFFRSGAWTSSQPVFMRKQDRIRRRFYQREPKASGNTVRDKRRRTFQDDYFMTQLPDSVGEGSREYDCNDSESGERGSLNSRKSPLEVKQSLLHIATIEMILQRQLYGKFTTVQTDFKWFGPSLPHATIFAVLEFFHVPSYYIEFCRKFVTMPLVFPDDGPDASVRTRKRGVPVGYTLADALSEAVLFCLDFAVNKKTRGIVQLYRFHDDVWFWGQEDTCLAAWKEVESFASVMGLELNKEKTGSFSLLADSAKKPAAGLPTGPIKWGFLVFEPSQARWVIDMESINEHISELRRQLAACRSVLMWIQAWNSYVRFFSTNFGQATNCMGRQHLDMVFSAFKHIQCELFASLDNENNSESVKDVSSYLNRWISSTNSQLGEIPDSFLAFPIEYGGLEVRNPFIRPMAIYQSSMEDPSKRLRQAFEDEEADYEEAKRVFETGIHGELDDTDNDFQRNTPEGCDAKTFFSFEEFTRFREETSVHLAAAYEDLLQMPKVQGVECTGTVSAALKHLPLDLKQSFTKFSEKFSDMDIYWQWVLQLYAKDAVSDFGGLVLGEPEVLPIELVKLLRSERVRWQG